MTPITARSLKPTRVEVSILSRSAWAWAGGQHGRLAAFDDMLWPARRMGGICRQRATSHLSVEAHADRGQMLFDRWLPFCGERLR
jgi:hypothetical protein